MDYLKAIAKGLLAVIAGAGVGFFTAFSTDLANSVSDKVCFDAIEAITYCYSFGPKFAMFTVKTWQSAIVGAGMAAFATLAAYIVQSPRNNAKGNRGPIYRQ